MAWPALAVQALFRGVQFLGSVEPDPKSWPRPVACQDWQAALAWLQ